MKHELLDQAGMLLLRKGFAVKILPRRWFDIIARREGEILIIKVLSDANSISSELASEMISICSMIGASPLIVAEKAGEALEEGVVYLRFGIHTVSLNTLSMSLDGKLPFIVSKNSGLTVAIDKDKLSKGIDEKGLSLSSLSRAVGVSKQMIVKYKSEKAEITVDKAERMFRIFGEGIFRKVNLFSISFEHGQEGKSEVAKKYERLGFRAVDTRKAPFDIVAKGTKEIILTEVGDKPRPDLSSITSMIDADKLLIYHKNKPKDRKMPNISKEDFLDIGTANELIKFLREFE